MQFLVLTGKAIDPKVLDSNISYVPVINKDC